MKRKIFIFSLLAICLALLSVGTLTYFTADATAQNVITAGGVSIEVVEQMRQGESGTLVDFPKEGIHDVMPGSAVSKIVRVKNTGASEAWIRVKVSMSLRSAQGEELPLTLEDGTPVMKFSVMNGWLDGGDGYYYYNASVKSEESTAVLFESIAFDSAMGNAYQGCTANITVMAQAVQTANNAIPENGTVMDVLGWQKEEDV